LSRVRQLRKTLFAEKVKSIDQIEAEKTRVRESQ
jgi:hypothetical protein